MLFGRRIFAYRQDVPGGQPPAGQQQSQQQQAPRQQQSAGPGQQQQQQQAAEAWRQQLPESLRDKPIDEIVKWGRSAHDQMGSLNKDLGAYKQQIEQLRPYQDAYSKWTGWYESIKPQWQQFMEWQQKQGQQPQGQQGAQAADQAFQNWENLTPQEQRQAMLDAISGHVDTHKKTLEQQMQQALARMQQQWGEREKYYQTYLNLRDQVWEEKLKNPNLDMQKAIQMATDALGGKIPPLELGIKLSTQDQQWDAREKALREQWEADRKAEAEKQMLTPPLSQGTPPSYKAPVTPSRGNNGSATREAIANALAQKFGQNIF